MIYGHYLLKLHISDNFLESPNLFLKLKLLKFFIHLHRFFYFFFMAIELNCGAFQREPILKFEPACESKLPQWRCCFTSHLRLIQLGHISGLFVFKLYHIILLFFNFLQFVL